MSTVASVNFLYKIYYGAAPNAPNPLILWLYYRCLRSPLFVRWLFGMRLLPTKELSVYFSDSPVPVFFNVATVILKRVLKEKMHYSKDLKLLEIGVGAYAVLSGYLSRQTTQTIDASDINTACVESAKKHVELNKINVRVLQSNLFSNLSGCKYDLIFWNLPCEDEDINCNLPNLFKVAASFMNKNAQLVLIYNSKILMRESVLDILSNSEQLYLDEIKTWWWNVQDVICVKKKSDCTSFS